MAQKSLSNHFHVDQSCLVGGFQRVWYDVWVAWFSRRLSNLLQGTFFTWLIYKRYNDHCCNSKYGQNRLQQIAEYYKDLAKETANYRTLNLSKV